MSVVAPSQATKTSFISSTESLKRGKGNNLLIELPSNDFRTIGRGFSCFGSCGTTRSGQGSCACDAKCMVYKNCCDDFQVYCNRQFEEFIQRFTHLAGVRSTCTEEDVLVISECPRLERGKTRTVIDKLRLSEMYRAQQGSLTPEEEKCWAGVWELEIGDEDNISDVTTEKTKVSPPLEHVNVVDIEAVIKTEAFPNPPLVSSTRTKSLKQLYFDSLENSYVTDITTGLVYANISIFLCGAEQSSVPCVWQLRFKVPKEKILSEMPQAVYVAPGEDVFKHNKFSLCNSQAREECDETSLYFTQDLQDKCRSRTAGVNVVDVATYRNIHCLKCTTKEGSIEEEKFVYRDPTSYTPKHQFSYMFTLAVLTNDKLELITNEDEHRGWVSTVCDLNEEFSCKVLDCSKDMIITEEDGCIEKNFLHVAVKTEQNTITRDAHRILGSLLQCVTQEHTHFLYRMGNRRVLTTYDFGGENLFGARFEVPPEDTSERLFVHRRDMLGGVYGDMEDFSNTWGVAIALAINWKGNQLRTGHPTSLTLDQTNHTEGLYKKPNPMEHIPVPFAIGISGEQDKCVFPSYIEQDMRKYNYSAMVAKLQNTDCFRSYQHDVIQLESSMAPMATSDAVLIVSVTFYMTVTPLHHLDFF